MNGILAPDGKFYYCLHQTHSDLVMTLMEKYDVSVQSNCTETEADTLKAWKFVFFSCGPIGEHIFVDSDFTFEPTQEQRTWVAENVDSIPEDQLSKLRWLFDRIPYWNTEVKE